MTELNNLFKNVFLVFISFICTLTPSIALSEVSSRPVSQRAQALQERRQQFEQEAAAAIPEVETEYAKFITYINSHQTPKDSNISDGLKFIAKNRKFLPVFNKQQKGDIYYTLSAWVYYFDKKPDKALKQVVSAYKLTPQNLKVVKTHLALSLIYGDYASIAEILAKQETPSSAEESEMLQDSPYQGPSDADLNLDISKIHPELLGKTLNIRPRMPSQNSSPADRNILCILLWKLEPDELNPASPASSPSANDENPEIIPYGQMNNQQAKISPLEVFSQLQNKYDSNTKIMFMGINFNDSANIKSFENWLAKNPQSWPVVPPSAELQQKLTSSINAAPDKPMILITGPDSTIRYLGDVDSFLPQMIIDNILDNPQEFIEPNEPNQPTLESQNVIEVILGKSGKPQRRSALPSDTNGLRKQSQSAGTTAAAGTSQNDIEEYQEFTADDYEAQKLLSNASTFLKIGNRLPAHIYRDPVEMCRRVMKDYPNTKYAQQAQMLLRNVPAEYRKQYDITDEELGL